jgi:hypothetical protein
MKASSRILGTAQFVAVMLLMPAIVNAQWRPPVVIDEGATAVIDIDLAMNAPGQAMVVWKSGVPDGDIYANYYERNEGFRGAENIEVSEVGPPDAPQVAMDNRGRARAVWRRMLDTQHFRVSHNSFTPENGGVWGMATYISDSRVGVPQIAMNAAGDTHTVWQRLVSGSLFVEGAAVAGTDVAFGDVQVLEPTTLLTSLSLAVDASGNAMVGYAFPDAITGWHLLRANLSSGLTWDPSDARTVAIAITPHVIMNAKIAINGPGTDGVVVWEDRNVLGAGRSDVYAATWQRSDGFWGSPSLIGGDTSISANPPSATGPQVGVDAAGRMLAIWTQEVGVGIEPQLYWSRRNAGAAEWESRQLLPSAAIPYTLQLAMNRNGNALAVWVERVGGRTSIASRYYSAATGTWTSVMKPGSLGSRVEVAAPKVGLDVHNNGLVVWKELFAGSENHLIASVFDAPP